MLYKYTTLEALALILKSKCIRLHPLTMMDDLQEAESDDNIKYAKYVFISSWMDQPLESIAMWKLYSNMESGVRIGMREMPFKRYTVNECEFRQFYSQIKLEKESIDLIAPVEECFGDSYFIQNFLYDQILEDVEYTDDKSLLSPKIFDIKPDGLSLQASKLGKYKNTYWEFQKEKRYILRINPFDVKKIKSGVNAAQFAYDAFNRDVEFLEYYDLKLCDEAYKSMQITLSPQFTAGNRVLLESLLNRYNEGVVVNESQLLGKIRM